MPIKREDCIEATKGLVAGGLVLVGLATGSNPFFTLLLSTSVGIGGDLLANIADKAFENWKDSWFIKRGSLDDHIKVGLQRTFIEVTHKLETEWRKQSSYGYMQYKGEYERAKLSITLIKELREEANRLFKENSNWPELNQTEIVNQIAIGGLSQTVIQETVAQIIDKYFGIVESLATFSKVYFAPTWIRCFHAYIQSDRGTAAWKVCQQLWQTSLFNALVTNQMTLISNRSEISDINNKVEKIMVWLKEWQEQLSLTEHSSIGAEAFSQVLQPAFNELNQKLENLAKDSQKIIQLFNEKFDSLDSEKVIVNFLQKELLREHNVNLEQAGHQAEEEISLSKVFVDLPISDEFVTEASIEDDSIDKLSNGFIAELVNAAQEPLDPHSLQIRKELTRLDEPSDSYQKLGKYVLIGGPGQGKTTMSQLACQLFRAAILSQKPQEGLTPKVKSVIHEIQNLCEDENIPSPRVPRIPFKIVLSDFAEQIAAKQSEVNSVLSYIKTRIRRVTDHAIEINNLRNWLRDYPWLLILDGLDEVPASSNRSEVLKAIEDFWIDANGVNADIMVIATTRPQGYNKEFAPNIYQHKYLLPLSNSRAMHYGNRLVKVRYKDDADRQKKIEERLKLALQEKTTARLMRSPLQVTIMSSLLGRVGTPPQERWSLFSQYYGVIYQRETERNIPASMILRRFEPDINAIHQRVGLLLQIESEHPERTASKLSQERFAKLVETRLHEEGHEGEQLLKLKGEIIDAAMNRLVFLVGVEAEEIGFEIRSLQEFMAAEALMNGGDDIVKERLKAIAPISHWRNAFLFAAGKCFVQKQYLRDTIHTLCASLNETESPGDYGVSGSIKMGSQLALALLEDGILLNQPNFTKLFTRLALQILELPPNELHLKLTNIYTPESYIIFEEELSKFLKTSHPQNIAAWTVISTLPNNTRINKLISKFWPNNSKIQLYLLDAIVNGFNAQWFTQKLRDIILDSPINKAIEQTTHKYTFKSNLELPLAWLRSNTNVFPKMMSLRLSVEKDENFVWFFDLVPIEIKKWSPSIPQDRFNDWKKIKKCHRDWFPFLAASRFLSNPTKESLSHELKQLVSQIKFPFDNINNYSNLPWPFFTILASVQSENELNEYAIKIEKGELGDKEDWLDAEERWYSKGITIEDLNYMTDAHWPYDKQIAKIGFPFVNAYIGFQSTAEDLGQKFKTFHRTLIDLLKDIQYTKFHQDLIDWIYFIIAIFNNHPQYANHLTKEDLLMLNEPDRQRQIPLEIIFIYYELAQEQDFIDFAEKIGRKSFEYPYFANYGEDDIQEKINILSEIFKRDFSHLGILNVLASICSYYKVNPNIPTEFFKATITDVKYRKAQVILQLLQGIGNIESLTLEIINLIDEQPQTMDDILRTIKTHKLIDLRTQRFLLHLYIDLKQRENYKALQSVIAALENIISQIRSNLTDSWSTLKLPQDLEKLITV